MNYNKISRKIEKIENNTTKNKFNVIYLKLNYNSTSSNQLSQINRYEVLSNTGKLETDIYIPLPNDISIPITNMIHVFPYFEIEPANADETMWQYTTIVQHGIHVSNNIPVGINIHLNINFTDEDNNELPIYLTLYLIGKSRREADEIRRN